MAARVCFVVGARPNFMKAAPVLRALEVRGLETLLVHTGQHYDVEMSDVFLEQFGLRRPAPMSSSASVPAAMQSRRRKRSRASSPSCSTCDRRSWWCPAMST